MEAEVDWCSQQFRIRGNFWKRQKWMVLPCCLQREQWCWFQSLQTYFTLGASTNVLQCIVLSYKVSDELLQQQKINWSTLLFAILQIWPFRSALEYSSRAWLRQCHLKMKTRFYFAFNIPAARTNFWKPSNCAQTWNLGPFKPLQLQLDLSIEDTDHLSTYSFVISLLSRPSKFESLEMEVENVF